MVDLYPWQHSLPYNNVLIFAFLIWNIGDENERENAINMKYYLSLVYILYSIILPLGVFYTGQESQKEGEGVFCWRVGVKISTIKK